MLCEVSVFSLIMPLSFSFHITHPEVLTKGVHGIIIVCAGDKNRELFRLSENDRHRKRECCK